MTGILTSSRAAEIPGSPKQVINTASKPSFSASFTFCRIFGIAIALSYSHSIEEDPLSTRDTPISVSGLAIA